MGWFSKDERPHESVVLALAVGELKGQLEALRRDVDRLKAPPPVAGETPKALPPRVVAVVRAMSQGHGELLRHLEEQARAMLADGNDEADIIAAIKRGG